MFCTDCGRALKPHWRFCDKCGAMINTAPRERRLSYAVPENYDVHNTTYMERRLRKTRRRRTA